MSRIDQAHHVSHAARAGMLARPHAGGGRGRVARTLSQKIYWLGLPHTAGAAALGGGTANGGLPNRSMGYVEHASRMLAKPSAGAAFCASGSSRLRRQREAARRQGQGYAAGGRAARPSMRQWRQVGPPSREFRHQAQQRLLCRPAGCMLQATRARSTPLRNGPLASRIRPLRAAGSGPLRAAGLMFPSLQRHRPHVFA